MLALLQAPLRVGTEEVDRYVVSPLLAGSGRLYDLCGTAAELPRVRLRLALWPCRRCVVPGSMQNGA